MYAFNSRVLHNCISTQTISREINFKWLILSFFLSNIEKYLAANIHIGRRINTKLSNKYFLKNNYLTFAKNSTNQLLLQLSCINN
jgi:hypothetical protein